MKNHSKSKKIMVGNLSNNTYLTKVQEIPNVMFGELDCLQVIQMPNIEKWHKTYTAPGGICDMTLLYYYAHNQETFVGLKLPTFPTIDNDLTQIFGNTLTFDLHLATHGNHLYPEEYETDNNNNKKIKYIDNQPYCFNKRLNKDIKFILLHFQGRNKGIMKDYYLKTN